MCVETGLSSVLASKSACVGKNAKFCYFFKKNVWVKGLNFIHALLKTVLLE